MHGERVQRRLVCILAADIVGYSALMGMDEAGTLERVKRHRSAILEPIISQYAGRIFKIMGDGILAEFNSATDAVQAAWDIQEATAASHSAETPDIALRIGIHLGDVIIENDDIYGDGVNIASRIESLADAGGVCISDDVFRQIHGKINCEFDDGGWHQVKNIAEKVHVHQAILECAAHGPRPSVRKAGGRKRLKVLSVVAVLAFCGLSASIWGWQYWHTPTNQASFDGETTNETADRPSIGVLPFTDLSESEDQSYFSDGLAEDLITDLSRISGLIVIARTSTFAYRGVSRDMREIGKELGARYILDGSVRKFDDRVRVVVQLVNTESGANIWADRFDRPINDLFDLQEDLRSQIVSALRVNLSAREKKWLSRRLTSNPDAYDRYLRGLQQMSFFTAEANAKAQKEFQRSIELDPGFAAAYAQLAQAYSLARENDWASDSMDHTEKALSLAKKAVELDDELPLAYWSLGRIYTRPPYRDSKKALEALEKAVLLDPNFADGFAFLASVLNASGHAEKALGSIENAMRINPTFPFWYYFELGRAQFFLTRFDFAADNFRKASERNPTVAWPHRWLISTYGHLGRADDADWEMTELEGLGAEATISESSALTTITDPNYLDLFLEGLRKAGMPEQ